MWTGLVAEAPPPIGKRRERSRPRTLQREVVNVSVRSGQWPDFLCLLTLLSKLEDEVFGLVCSFPEVWVDLERFIGLSHRFEVRPDERMFRREERATVRIGEDGCLEGSDSPREGDDLLLVHPHEGVEDGQIGGALGEPHALCRMKRTCQRRCPVMMQE